MQKTILGYSRFIYSVQAVVVLLLFYGKANAQHSVYEHDVRYSNRFFHFGITLGVNNSNYKITPDSTFIVQNQVLRMESARGLGFNLGILSDLHLSNRFELRFIPTLSLGEKNLNFFMRNTDTTTTKKIESVYLEFPVHLKYKSKPYKDAKPYIIGGIKYSNDLQSNAGARKAENLIKVNRNDFAFEYGVGIEFHLPLVIISPEVKFTYGLLDVLSPDPQLIQSAVLERLRTRTVLFCVHFEG